MNNILVSVVIPTYNRTVSVRNCINSVLNSQELPVEVILVDDNKKSWNGENELFEIISPYLELINFVYVRHLDNRGGAAARNTGISIAKGDYIAFLDDDDMYLPKKLFYQINFLDNNSEYDAVYCGVIKRGNTIIDDREGDLSYDLLLMNTNLYTPTLVFRANILRLLNGFDETFRRHQDYELLLRFFQHYKIGVVSQALCMIGENNGENCLRGKELESMKQQFLEKFENCIYDKKYNYKKIKREHYVVVAFEYLKSFEIVNFIKLLLNQQFYIDCFFLCKLISIIMIRICVKLKKDLSFFS